VLRGNRTRIALGLTAAVVLAGAGAYSWQRFAPRATPAGQPPLVQLSAESLAGLSGAFDEAADRTRILALLSPT
jgi:hypothetical protein